MSLVSRKNSFPSSRFVILSGRGRNRRGFSLAEILVALAVLSILLFPLLAIFRELYRADARLERQFRVRMALEQEISRVQLAACAGVAPAPVVQRWIGANNGRGLRSRQWADAMSDRDDRERSVHVRICVSDVSGNSADEAVFHVRVAENAGIGER